MFSVAFRKHQFSLCQRKPTNGRICFHLPHALPQLQSKESQIESIWCEINNLVHPLDTFQINRSLSNSTRRNKLAGRGWFPTQKCRASGPGFDCVKVFLTARLRSWLRILWRSPNKFQIGIKDVIIARLINAATRFSTWLPFIVVLIRFEWKYRFERSKNALIAFVGHFSSYTGAKKERRR